MVGRIIDNVEYIELLFNNKLKSKSLEDNIFYTLRDIFWNCDEEYDIRMTKRFNKNLISNNFFDNGEYTDVLYDYYSDFTKELYEYLKNFKKEKIYFIEDKDEEKENEYIKFDDWWSQLQQLIKKLEEQLEKHIIWEKEDMEEDLDF